MPAAAVIIPAVAGIAGSLIAAHGNSEATKTQAGTASSALDFAKAQEAERRKEWDTQQQAARDAWTARQAMMAPFLAGGQSVLQKYGISAPTPSMPAGLSAPMPAGGAMGSNSVPPPAMPSLPGVSVAPLSPAQIPAPKAVPQGSTVGSLMDPSTQNPGGPQTATDWSDWNRYLGGPNA